MERRAGGARLYFVLLLVSMWALNANTERLGGEVAADQVPGTRALKKETAAVNELDDAVTHLHHKRARERSSKAQHAVRYMENYSAKKNTMQKESARLRARIERDRVELLKNNPKLSKAHERTRKHDEVVKKNMKAAVHAMHKVDQLVHGAVLPDPTVRMAKKQAMKAHGKEIFTVLGLDKKQLGKDYMLEMDAAVAAYDTKPSAKAQEKLSKTIETTKERMGKELKLKRKANNERNAKRHRSEKNHKFYATKWAEKKNELHRKKVARDKFVHKLKAKEHHQKWVRRRTEDEKAKKKAIVDKRTRKRKAKLLKKQRLKAGKLRKKVFIRKQATKKFSAEARKLDKKARVKYRDFSKLKKSKILAKVKVSRAKSAVERQNKNLIFAKRQVKASAVSYGRAKEAKGKHSSELTGKFVSKRGAWMRSRVARARERGFKVKAAKKLQTVSGKVYATTNIKLKRAKPKWLKATQKSVKYKKLKASKVAKYVKKMSGIARRRRSLAARRRRRRMT